MKKRIVCLLLAVMMLVGVVGILASCGGDGDDDKPCVECVDANKDGKCDACGGPVSNNGGNTGGNGGNANHTCEDNDGDLRCDQCKKDVTPDYPWDDTELLFKMTHNSNQEQLSSTCGRYLAGEYDGKTDELDDEVLMRNAEAYLSTKVTVTYDYYDNSTAYGWGSAVTKIVEEVSSNSQKTIPDMYCNFVYDMVAASLNGCFANLLSTNLGTGDLKGLNYFAFTKSGYLEDGQEFPDDDKGYMYEYMRSTTLSKYKMYILASDYFTDMVRAFFVVPVNVALLEQVGGTITGDLDNSGSFTLDDFYMEVNQNKWTYNKLAEYAAAISTTSGTEQSFEDILGFALSENGLPASGIVYSTDLTIVKRTWDPDANDYTYEYPDVESPEAQAFFEMSRCLADLFTKPGVFCTRGSDYSSYGQNTMLAVRNQFCKNRILFGGIECVGALEEPVYQTLKTGTGFGVVPVPLYKEAEEGSDMTYLTSIHNVGRPGAIARTTKSFAQCTAFLNYQSTHSEDILETYYESRLQYGATDGNTGTVEMLDYIRSNVRSAFDKTMEDAVGYKYNTGSERWHSILANKNYSLDITQAYKERIGDKQAYLLQLIGVFEAMQ